jgi:hypothetical protein
MVVLHTTSSMGGQRTVPGLTSALLVTLADDNLTQLKKYRAACRRVIDITSLAFRGARRAIKKGFVCIFNGLQCAQGRVKSSILNIKSI